MVLWLVMKFIHGDNQVSPASGGSQNPTGLSVRPQDLTNPPSTPAGTPLDFKILSCGTGCSERPNFVSFYTPMHYKSVF